MGWKVTGLQPPSERKYLIIAAPHTSMWDFVLLVLARSISRIKSSYMIKSSFFKNPILGWLLLKLGAVPVHRGKNNSLVETTVDEYHKREQFVITITPEGTRKKVNRLKSGFYHIANQADVPVCLVSMDYKNKVVHVSQPKKLDSDKDTVLKDTLDYFRQFQGKHPEKGPA